MSESKYIHGTQSAEQQRLAALNQLTNSAFLQFLQLDGAKRVLEVGCGMGILTQEVAARLPAAEVVGIEYSDDQLARATHQLPNLRLAKGDAHHLPFAGDQYDVVYCRWVLEHVADPARVLQEMHRVLRPGGRVFVMENDIAMQRDDRPLLHFEKIWQQLGVLQKELGGDAFIGRRLFQLLKGAGFVDIELSMANDVHWFGSPGFSVWVINEINILEGCRDELLAHQLATHQEIDSAMSELRALDEQADASSWFYWNRATGRK